MKKAELGEGAKANHLSYLGDAGRWEGREHRGGIYYISIYDGYPKFETIIEDSVFIGSDTQLVAPITVGRGSVIAAGTTLTQDVPPDSLAISRTVQANRVGWASKRRALLENPDLGGTSGKDRATKATNPNLNQTAPKVRPKGKAAAPRHTSPPRPIDRRKDTHYVWNRWIRGRSRRGSYSLERAEAAGVSRV